MTILFCTTESLLLTSLEYRFRKNGWELKVANNAKGALDATLELQPGIIIVDLQMPAYEGLEIVQNAQNKNRGDTPVLVGGLMKNENLLLEALRLGARDFIVAPFKPDELVLRIKRLLNIQKVAG